MRDSRSLPVRVPARLRPLVDRMMARWPGRIALRLIAGCVRLEVFDRAMTIAAQLFTSVFPILIMAATWLAPSQGSEFVELLGVPPESRRVLEDALTASSSSSFGVLGSLIVLASATSLSRALTRAFAAAWDLPRPKSRLIFGWRWIVAVLGLAAYLVLLRLIDHFTDELPIPVLWHLTVALVGDVAMAIFVPRILLAGRLSSRQLLPGAALFALAMLFVRPASWVFLPPAMATSAERYGPLGVAFTYLAFLYIVAFCFLLTAAAGNVVATDPSPVGRWFQVPASGERPVERDTGRAARGTRLPEDRRADPGGVGAGGAEA